MRKRPPFIVTIAFLGCIGAWAQGSSATKSAVRTIRITGDPAIEKLVDAWEQRFHVNHPEIKFENRLTGPASALAGLYTGVADLAFAGHELLTSESMAFEWIFHSKALPIEVMSGSLSGPSFAPGFFVNAGNPLSVLTLTQAAAVLSCEPRSGGKVVRNWGDLGLKGKWVEEPIHLYGYDPENELGIFIRRKILKNS